MPFFNSVVHSKCPKCNLDDLYVDNNPYHLSKLGQMKKKCGCCGQLFEPETGFYYGAMYVSYALGVAVMVVPALILSFVFDLGFVPLLIFVVSTYIIGFPLFFRFSRNIWLNIFVRFDPELQKKVKNKAAE